MVKMGAYRHYKDMRWGKKKQKKPFRTEMIMLPVKSVLKTNIETQLSEYMKCVY